MTAFLSGHKICYNSSGAQTDILFFKHNNVSSWHEMTQAPLACSMYTLTSVHCCVFLGNVATVYTKAHSSLVSTALIGAVHRPAGTTVLITMIIYYCYDATSMTAFLYSHKNLLTLQVHIPLCNQINVCSWHEMTQAPSACSMYTSVYCRVSLGRVAAVYTKGPQLSRVYCIHGSSALGSKDQCSD